MEGTKYRGDYLKSRWAPVNSSVLRSACPHMGRTAAMHERFKSSCDSRNARRGAAEGISSLGLAAAAEEGEEQNVRGIISGAGDQGPM